MTVVSLELQPVTAWCWRTTAGNSWQIQDNGDATEFLQFVRERISDQVWDQAATHYCGAGAKNCGIAPGTVERLLRAQQPKNDWEAYGMNIATISAGIWPRERLFLAGLVDSLLCQRCGEGTDDDVEEDLVHRYWDCHANEHIDHPDVKDTQHMAHGDHGALKQGEAFLLFWSRGLCPRAIYPLP